MKNKMILSLFMLAFSGVCITACGNRSAVLESDESWVLEGEGNQNAEYEKEVEDNSSVENTEVDIDEVSEEKEPEEELEEVELSECEKNGHTLNSKGKCDVCGEQVGFGLNMSNYEDYLSVEFDIYKDEYGYHIDCITEPMKNVIFKDVEIYYEYTAKNSSFKSQNGVVERTFWLTSYEEDGYGKRGYMADSNETYGTTISNPKITGISGYIIE